MVKQIIPWNQRIWDWIKSNFRWLIPGMGVKRWFLLTLAGTTLTGVGFAILILEVYRTTPETWWLPLLSAASLRFLARPLRAIIFGGLGLGMIVGGILGLNRSLIKPFVKPGKKVVETISNHRKRERGARIVAIGGGHGLSTLLRGLKQYSYNLSAVVTVADDGGSSGRIRREMGILPPGDIRNCLAALSNDEALLSQLFQYRFPDGEGKMEGHSFGNLFISALSEITGSFEEAVAESGRVLGVQGQVLPSTLHDVKLVADMLLPNLEYEVRVEGESSIPVMPGKVRHVWLEPNSPPGFPQSIRAILNADMIVIGPGSLYTSILPNLLVPDVAEAIRSSRGFKVFVCNLATQPGETDGYDCEDHIMALEEHVGRGIFDLVVANQQWQPPLPDTVQWVQIEPGAEDRYPIYQTNLVDRDYPWRHDSIKLAQILLELLQERTGPLGE
ncbi:MAG: YvcK family protein [Anaerolineales bacterium]|nr:YvcK family protein [Anaerolineales bacterium]